MDACAPRVPIFRSFAPVRAGLMSASGDAVSENSPELEESNAGTSCRIMGGHVQERCGRATTAIASALELTLFLLGPVADPSKKA